MAKRRSASVRSGPPAPRGARRLGVWLAMAGVLVLGGVLYVSTRAERQDPDPAVITSAASRTPVYGHAVVRDYPHDRQAFTQGLVYREGFLYESTGQYGESSLRKVELESGTVVQSRRIPPRYFAEGLVDWKDRLIQLTWKENVGFVYGLQSFEPRTTFAYGGEGWGLTHDGRRIIMSDGSPRLRFLDPETLRETGSLQVSDSRGPVHNLNELEYVKGDVYANVWGDDRIAIIDPGSGRVRAWIDLAGILRPAARTGAEDVLNGIAYDSEGDRLFVTGKYWPRLFEIRVRTDTAR